MISVDMGTLAILVTIIGQTGGGIWWFASFSAQMKTRIQHLEMQTQGNEGLGARMASLEASVKALSITLDRVYSELKTKADK